MAGERPSQGDGGWSWLLFGVATLALAAACLDQANPHQELHLLAATTGLLLLGLITALARHPDQGRLPVGWLGILLLAFWAWGALATLWGQVPYLTVAQIVYFANVVLAYAAWRIATASSERRPVPELGIALAVASALMAGLMIGQSISGSDATGLFLNPNSAAALINVLWPPVAMAWLVGAGRVLGAPALQIALLPALFILAPASASTAAVPHSWRRSPRSW